MHEINATTINNSIRVTRVLEKFSPPFLIKPGFFLCKEILGDWDSGRIEEFSRQV
jgi:hypothetical protein